jgi:DNA-binding GntR family transcriptional regulator
LREAFRLLERERLVVNIPRKGTYVTEVSMDDLHRVYEAREMIECYGIKLLEIQNIRKIPEAEIAIKTATELPAPSFNDLKEYLKYYDAVSNFHSKMIAATQNPWLIDFKYAIYSQQARYRILNIKRTQASGSLSIGINEHREILSAIKEGNYNRALETMRHHVQRGLLRYRNGFKSKICG